MQDEGEQCDIGLMLVVPVGCGRADDGDEAKSLGLADEGRMVKDYIK